MPQNKEEIENLTGLISEMDDLIKKSDAALRRHQVESSKQAAQAEKELLAVGEHLEELVGQSIIPPEGIAA
jgi:hypothetical protein